MHQLCRLLQTSSDALDREKVNEGIEFRVGQLAKPGISAAILNVRLINKRIELRPFFSQPIKGERCKSIGGKETAIRKFNLSQFDGPQDIANALHRVRDAALTSSVPIIFWDEFDSSRDSHDYAWLRYFLAPMQDGEFQQGEIVHPLGRCVFVFAGGINHSSKDFMRNSEDDKYKSQKLPDFASCLKGFLDVLGPDRRKQEYRNDQSSGHGDNDEGFIIRRSILLRSIIWRHHPAIFESENVNGELRIDDGVLNAFLNTKEYKHGIRSMESIVIASQLTNQSVFERSSLPPPEQLKLHVNENDFISLIRSTVLAS